ncbi:2-acylglycerol O-acyltransferase 1-like [Lutzomyia longipalpis]|uniref:2-acylglycerol O-acyltransferase 1-like n=1 Tax=Lutzomyia longipalpis TaxID=7200 RepID=UPI002483B98B|nr:2-acylglycerol O-acyltransferase 1-like [Lutzomyia longipalpis]
MKIEWAPLNVPFHRRMETLAAAAWMILILFGELIALFFYLFLLIRGNIYIQTLCVIYFIFLYYDRGAGENGGRGQGSKWVRNWTWWRYYRNYFPVHLVKTADLPADRNYLFAAFPHGLLSSAAFTNFNTDTTKWAELFPGVRSKLVTLGFHFYIPIFRELLLSWGMVSVSAKSLHNLLTWPNEKNHPRNSDGNTSTACVIVVGGAQEALNTRPNNYQLVLKKRKGFVKMALRTGTSLVPVMSFGELDLFDQPPNPPGSLLRRYQEFVKRVTGIAPAKFIGRGFFQYSYGMIPRRKELFTVVGAPIEVPKIDEPKTEDIEKYHEEFCKALTELFNTHKIKYIKDHENVQLIIE